MRESTARKLSERLKTVRDCYFAKSCGEPYSVSELAIAENYIKKHIASFSKKADNFERAFLAECFAILDSLREEGNDLKIADCAHAIHRVPLLFCGKERWNKAFKKEFIRPFCEKYGDGLFAGILQKEFPHAYAPKKKKTRPYGAHNFLSLPMYFCYRLILPLLVLPFLTIAILLVHFVDYIEDHRGDRYEVTVEGFEYDSALILYCEGFREHFEAVRFSQYSTEPEKLISLCENGGELVVYADYKRSNKNRSAYYKIVQLEDKYGNVYRTYEHTNKLDRYVLLFLWIVWLVFFLPAAVMFTLMLIVARNPAKYRAHPKLMHFCFPEYTF